MLGRISGRGLTIFPKPSAPALGNQLPGNTGAPWGAYRPGPGGTALGSGGQLGGNDGLTGTDPRVGRIQPRPVFLPGQNPVNSDTGMASERESFWRGGIQGFNDQLTVKDRHAYWDTGNQKTGLEGFYPAGSPNTYNDPVENPPRPDLRTVNRTVSATRRARTLPATRMTSRAATRGWVSRAPGGPASTAASPASTPPMAAAAVSPTRWCLRLSTARLRTVPRWSGAAPPTVCTRKPRGRAVRSSLPARG